MNTGADTIWEDAGRSNPRRGLLAALRDAAARAASGLRALVAAAAVGKRAAVPLAQVAAAAPAASGTSRAGEVSRVLQARQLGSTVVVHWHDTHQSEAVWVPHHRAKQGQVLHLLGRYGSHDGVSQPRFYVDQVQRVGSPLRLGLSRRRPSARPEA